MKKIQAIIHCMTQPLSDCLVTRSRDLCRCVSAGMLPGTGSSLSKSTAAADAPEPKVNLDDPCASEYFKADNGLVGACLPWDVLSSCCRPEPERLAELVPALRRLEEFGAVLSLTTDEGRSRAG